MKSYLQGITKNQTFRLYFDTIGEYTDDFFSPNAYVGASAVRAISVSTIGNSNFTISKDGGAFAQTTNSPVEISTGYNYVDLTADEMNADVIQFRVFYNSGSIVQNQSRCVSCINIYTAIVGITAQDVWEYISRTVTGGTVSGSSTVNSPAVMTSICKAVQQDYIVIQKAQDESGYNYYGLTNIKSPWWMIIQESTDFSDIGYKMAKEKRLSFVDGWANRATLNYGDQFPLK